MNLNLKRKNIKQILHYAVLMFLLMLFIFPLVWMIVSSFKPEKVLISDLYSGLKAFWPTKVTLHNYVKAFQRVPFARYLFNSIFVTGSTVGLMLIVNSMAGYAFARFDFPGKDILFTMIIALIIVPGQSILLPRFLIVNKLGWLNSYTGLIVPSVANALAIFIFRQFFLNIPKEVEEAARLDGCSLMRMFFSIIVPMSKPVFASVAILNVTAIWNQFLWPLIILNQESMFTIQIGIAKFFHRSPVYYGQVMAALTVASIPMFILFFILQDYFVEGMSGMGK